MPKLSEILKDQCCGNMLDVENPKQTLVERAQELEAIVELLTVKRSRRDCSSNYPSAIEMIRCGIGSNYGGVYFEEVMEAVRGPLIRLVNKYQERNSKC